MSNETLGRLGVIVAFVALIFAAKEGYRRMQISAFNKQGEIAALEFADIQKRHYEQHREYISDIGRMNSTILSNLNPNVKVYHNDELIPVEYRPLIGKVGLPFLTRDDYRIYVEVQNLHDSKVYFWVVNPNNSPQLMVTDIVVSTVAGHN